MPSGVSQDSATLVAALRANPDLAVFDAPPAGRSPPYVVIARHDVLPRDGDGTPGNEHRVLFHAWAAEPSRKAVLALAEAVVGIALGVSLGSASLRVTLRRHDRTDTAIDGGSGRARAAVAMTFYTEAN
eukprot:gene39787-52512_t